MEPNNNSNNMMNGLPPLPRENNKVGPIVGALVIVLIIVIAALYFFSRNLNMQTPVDNTVPTEQSQQNTSTDNTSGSVNVDSASSINADLDSQLKDVDYSF